MTEWGLTLITAPSEEPLTLEDVREHLRLIQSYEDQYLLRLIRQARAYAENVLHQQLITATYRYDIDAFPWYDDPIRLPKPPLQSVGSITYVDSDDVRQTVNTDVYDVDTSRWPGRIELAYGQSWPVERPEANTVQITFTCGYGLRPSVPEEIKGAMLMLIGHWHEHREEVTGGNMRRIPDAANAMLMQRSTPLTL